MTHRRPLFTRLLALLLAASLTGVPAALAAEAEGDTPPVAAIYTTSDMMGRLYEEDPLTGLLQTATYGRAASALADESLPAPALLLDAGNAVYTGLTGEDGSAAARVLRALGYDALVPGVEEFRLGAGYRADFFENLADSQGSGGPVDVLAANLLERDGSPAAEPYMVYDLDLGDAQVRVGVLGLTDPDTAGQLPQRLYGSLRFTHSANEEGSLAWEWERYQAQLERECDLTVVVCRGSAEELARFAATTTGIDLLVGGSDQAGTDVFLNKDGQSVPYVCGGGSALTRTVLTLDEAGAPVLGESALLALNRYSDDSALASLTAASAASLERAGAARAGTLSGQWEEGFSLTRQTDTADLIGEALLWATDADAALFSPGSLGGFSAAVLFARGVPTASLTLADCAALAPDLSPVVTVELTGGQLRQWLDVCAGRYSISDAGQPAGGEDADGLYGLDYALHLGDEAGRRVFGLTYQDGPVAEDRVFTVALPASRLSDPEFPACTVLWSASAGQDFASQGGSTAALLAAYARDASRRGRALSPVRSSQWAIYPEAGGAGLTRLDLVEMLYDLAGRPQPGASFAFMDVEDSNAVIWAAETGIVTGDGRGSFLPLDPVNREQAAVMLYNYALRVGGAEPAASDEETDSALDAMLDGGAVAQWARPAVEFCLSAGIIPAAGVRGDLYLPGDPVTRTEARSFLARLADYLE